VHKIGAVLLLILLIIVSIYIGWEDEEPKLISMPVENTTEIFTKKDTGQQQDKRFKLEKTKEDMLDNISHNLTDETTKVEIPAPEKNTATFTLVNTKEVNHTVTLSGQKFVFHTSQKPIVLVNLFATWCPPCIGEIPYLNDLQKKYQNELFVTGILTHDTIDQPSLETFMAKNQVNYFISNGTENDAFSNLLASTLHLPENFSIPLTVMYVEGEYFTHYEGIVPVEMIEYDIQQAKQQLKSR
jgi:thiol-disulfide isomerase/thioredoxin